MPVTAACAVTLGGLTAWAASGAAGRPANVHVTNARLILPFVTGDQTAALFRLTNPGASGDELTAVTSPETGPARLGRSVVRSGAGTMSMLPSVEVPAHGTLSMSPQGLDVMVDDPRPLHVGQRVPFVLYFRDSGPVRVTAVVVRPQDATG